MLRFHNIAKSNNVMESFVRDFDSVIIFEM